MKNKKTTQEKTKKRTKEESISQIYRTLQLSERPLTTSQVAKKVNLSHRSTLSHLKFLEFDDRVKCFRRGTGSWIYWKIKR